MKFAVIWLTLILILGNVLLVVTHEIVHSEINRHYGIESEITWFDHEEGSAWWKWSSTTRGDKPCPTEECKLAHNLNEVVGYPLSIIFSIFGVFLLIIALSTLYRTEQQAEWQRELRESMSQEQ